MFASLVQFDFISGLRPSFPFGVKIMNIRPRGDGISASSLSSVSRKSQQLIRVRGPRRRAVIDRRYSYQESPSVNICTWLPPGAGFMKIVNFAGPRFLFRIEDCG